MKRSNSCSSTQEGVHHLKPKGQANPEEINAHNSELCSDIKSITTTNYQRSNWCGAMVCIGLALTLFFPSRARAADVVYEFNTVFSYSGSLPSPTGPAPWLTATFQDVTPGTVDLTINTSGLQGTEFISDFYLNLDPNVNPTSLTFTETGSTGSFTAPNVGLSENTYKADGDGYYDIDLGFSTSHGSTFTVGDSITYKITGSGIDAASFEFGSEMGGGAGTWLAAAHVQSIGSDGSSSAWIAPAPEPSSVTLLLVAAGLWFGGRRLVSRTK